MSSYRTGFPLTIANVLMSNDDVKGLFEVMVEEVYKLKKDSNNPDFIPPIVYSEAGKAFNVEYNFLVHCLAWSADEPMIENDFKMSEMSGVEVFKSAEFFVVGLLENYFEIARINPKTIDPSRFKSARRIDLPIRFYNPLCIQNGENVVRFNAVPLNAQKLKKYINEDIYAQLEMISRRPQHVQIAFGEYHVQEYKRTNPNLEIDYVF